MICVACKHGIHEEQGVYVLPLDGSSTPQLIEPCRGGTWCDCQHRQNVVIPAAQLVTRKHDALLGRLA